MKFRKLVYSILLFTAFISRSLVYAGDIILPPVSASILYADPIQAINMTMAIDANPAGEGYNEMASIGGMVCRKVAAGKYMYITCSRAAVPTSSEKVILSITYFDSSMNNLWVNYTRAGSSWGGADFQKSNTGKWVTRIITLTDAGLDGTMGYGGDIRIGFGTEDNYIRDIKLYVGTLDPEAQPIPSKINDPLSSFLGRSFAGYQLWHQAGPNPQDWSHWAYGKVPAAGRGNHNIETFPNIADFEDNPAVSMYPTNFANLGNGGKALLYNSTDKGVIGVQMGLLQRAGFDGIAIQRNAPVGRALKYTSTDDYCVSIKNACETNKRLFYIMYCMPDANNSTSLPEDVVEGIKRDWVYQMEEIYALTSSHAYATVDGKPVVELWGLGYSTILVNRVQALELAQFFKDRGCYVIAGTPRDWRLMNEGSRADFADVYTAYDMISPWTVGAYNDIEGANNFKTNYLVPDKIFCDQHSIGYYPVVYPGSAWSQHVSGYPNDAPRLGGRYLWQQALNVKSIHVPSMYFAMLDEFEESTNIISSAVDYFDIPTDQYFGTQSMDGIWSSPDYYLRLAGTAARMLTSAASPAVIPIPYSNGPIYYRNSFESRIANCIIDNVARDILAPIDPRFFKDTLVTSRSVSNASVTILNTPAFAKSGNYVVEINGAGSGTSSYYYKISDTKIILKPNMHLVFWKYTVNEGGRYSSVDIGFSSGKQLHALPFYTDNYGNSMQVSVPRGLIGSWQKFTCQLGKGELVGDTITSIIIGYDNPAANGQFTAYFDDIIIENAVDQSCPNATAIWTGAINSAWENPGNWNCAALPDASTDVVIQSGLVNYPVINSYVICKSISLNSEASLKVNPGYTISINKP